MTLLLFSAIILLIAVTRSLIFGDVGVAITAFLLGCFGYLTYPILVLLIYASVVMVSGKRMIPGKWLALACALVCAVFLVVHLATSAAFSGGYGEYLADCFTAGEGGAATATAGGALFGLIVFPVKSLLSVAGAYVFFSLLIVVALFFILRATPLKSRMTFRPVRREKACEPRVSGTRAYPGDVSFEEMEVPSREPELDRARAARAQAQEQPASATDYVRSAMAEDDRRAQEAAARPLDPYQRSREILFSTDPATSYRNNLIYDSDSYFNSRARRNNAVSGTEGTAPRRDAPQPAQSASYSERYVSRTDESRSRIPKKIVSERDPSAGYTYPRASSAEDAEISDVDLNYPQRPSYKAEESGTSSVRDYYRNDVTPYGRGDASPYEEEFSSAPNISDIAQTPPASTPVQAAESFRAERVQPSAQEPFESSRATGTADSFRAERVQPPAQEPFESSRTTGTADSFRAERVQPPAQEPFESSRATGTADSFRAERVKPPAQEPFERSRTAGTAESFRAERIQPPAQEPESDAPLGGRGFGETADESSVRFRSPERTERWQEDVSRRDGDQGFVSDPLQERSERFSEEKKPVRPSSGDAEVRSREAGFRSLFSRSSEEEEDEPSVPESRVFDSRIGDTPSRSNADMFDDDDVDDGMTEIEEEPPRAPTMRAPRTFERREERGESFAQPAAEAPAPEKHVFKAYVNPSVSLFSDYDDSVSVSQEEIERNSAIITETLAGFRVDAEVVKVTCGSAVTRYDIDIPKNIAVRSVIKHDAEIAMRLHARDGVNIYSNSEVGAISIEVPNSKRATVGLKSVLQAEEFQANKPGALIFAIGKDVEGRNVCGNIVKMKHILVAGATGSGKSVCLNAMLISLICKYSPEDLRLILIDPKKVEFAIYDGLPHLMINEIIADAQKAVSALNWAIKEMERRYLLFEQKTRSGKLVHNVDEYNRNLNENEEKLPKVVIVVDELADLMSVAKKDIEDRIQRLSQKARAAGIHLVIATQRPSVDVITGVIKGNLPTRMAFRVIQEVDSRTILDSSGAEKLLGNGDMLYRTEGMFSSCRVQGAFLSSEEVQAVVEDIKAHNEAYFDSNIADYINNADKGQAADGGSDDMDGDAVDPQYIKALAIVVKLGSASISLIQRKCSVGYNHAGKIIEWMELMGYISPFDGKAKARTVLLSKEEFESKYGSLD